MSSTIISIDGAQCKTKSELFDTFCKTLDFPDYFGNNWDSFEEIINDLELPINTQILITNYKLLLEQYKEDKTIFKEILAQANLENAYKFYKIQLF
ncbi:MAG TPA: barstar family protein [Saprospiraceae bacterium]|nr:barstar family protein [Saprospiraceae bacterium]